MGFGTNVRKDVLKVYPNPSTSQVNMDLEGFSERFTIQVFNTTGTVVYESAFENEATINLTLPKPNGLYHIVVSDDEKTAIANVFKND